MSEFESKVPLIKFRNSPEELVNRLSILNEGTL
jgi:hypothetical protein